jgi:glycosyltransferase involved in cell wall biosynthesis
MQKMQSLGYSVFAIAPEDKYSYEFKKYNIEFIPITLSRKGYNIFNEFYLIVQLYKIYRNISPEIIHHFTIKPVIFGSIAARLSGISTIINSITGLGYVFQQGWLIRKIIIWIYQISLNSTSINNIFQNPDDMNEFIKIKISHKNNSHLILSSGVDTTLFRHIKYEKSMHRIHFLFLSRMLLDKGLNELKEAVYLLREQTTNFTLTLAGAIDRGNPRSVSETWMKTSFDSPNCEWIGYEEDIVSLLERADVVVLPSYYREGVPHCLIEALAASKPIITTDMAGCREVIHENGILIQPKDSNALFRAMLKMVNSNKLKNWSKDSFKQASKFDINLVNQQTLLLYGIN